MARINIEDTLWSDPRFLRLCVKLGDEMRAVGAIVLAWKCAQRYYCPDRKPIPAAVFAEIQLPPELIECCLAERTENNDVRMRGAEEHFSWWFQRQEAGKKGGRPSNENREKAAAKREKATANRPLNDRKRVKPSSSSSFSSSNSKKEDLSERPLSLRDAVATHIPLVEIAVPPEPEPKARPPGQLFIATYMRAFREKYGVYPPITGKDRGIVKRLVDEQPIDRLLLWIQGYFQVRDEWFKTKCHDLATFEQNLAKVAAAVDSGSEIPGQKNWWEGLEVNSDVSGV